MVIKCFLEQPRDTDQNERESSPDRSFSGFTTTPRTSRSDARLRAELLASTKERHEHDIVVKDIKESLTTAGVA